MGGTPADSSSTTSFMTAAVVNERTTKPTAMPPLKPSSADEEGIVSVILPALMLLEMEDAGDCSSSSSSSSCDEESLSHRSSSTRSLATQQQRKVGFANVQVREYTVTVGDHPCCTQGCALSLDWGYQEGATLTLDAFESARAAQRRHRNGLRTTWEERRRILSRECSDGELRKAQRKLHRARSCNSHLCEKMSESFFQSSA